MTKNLRCFLKQTQAWGQFQETVKWLISPLKPSGPPLLRKRNTREKAVKRLQNIYTWWSTQTNKKIHHHQLKRLFKLKSITRSAWPNTFHYINTKLTWYYASIFNFSVHNKMRAGIPSTFKVQTFHLVTTSITHQRGASTPHSFSDQQLYGPTKYFPSRFLTRSVSKTSNNKCLKTCSPALMCLLF